MSLSFSSSPTRTLDTHGRLQLPHPDHPGEGHTDSVYGVHLQHDYLVSVSADHTVRTWDLNTQRALRPPLVGHPASVVSVHSDAASHEDVIVTGDVLGNVIIWRFSTGDTVKTITEAHADSVLSLHFDHTYLVTGSRDNTIKLWNRRLRDVNENGVLKFATAPVEGDRYQEYELLATLDAHAPVLDLKLRDNVLVSGTGDSTICIWSMNTGQVLQKINIHQSGVACLQFNGRFIVSGSTDFSAKIYDVNHNSEVACLEGHNSLIKSLQVLFDDRGNPQTIASGDYDGTIRIWEQMPGSGEWRTKQQLHVDFQAQEDVDENASRRRWSNPMTFKDNKDIKASSWSSRIFSIDLDGRRLVCSGHGPVIRLWNFVQPGE